MYLTAIFFPDTRGGGVVTRRSLSHLLRIQVLMRLDHESCTLTTAHTHTHTHARKEEEVEAKNARQASVR